MKILHIAYSGLGGHGNVFFSMTDADTTKQNEYEVIFFGTEEVRAGYKEKAIQNGIPWFYVPKKPGIDFNAYKNIGRIIKERKPEVVFLHSSSYILPVKKAMLFSSQKFKLIVRETQANHLKTKANWVGLCISLVVADKVVFLSSEYRDEVKKRLPLFFSDKRTTVIPNGVDLNVYKPAEKTSPTTINIGMQSRLSDNKDHPTLINAFAQLLQSGINKPVKLFIAGDGTCRQQLEKQVQHLGIANSVEFMGMLEEKDLPSFINSLNIYVHATFGETMSTAIMQVMACRKPIIASNVLGVDNMIMDKENGLLVPLQNIDEMAKAMMMLINDPALANKLAEGAYEFARNNYSNKTMLDRYNKIFGS